MPGCWIITGSSKASKKRPAVFLHTAGRYLSKSDGANSTIYLPR
jgi:hypothetical protein